MFYSNWCFHFDSYSHNHSANILSLLQVPHQFGNVFGISNQTLYSILILLSILSLLVFCFFLNLYLLLWWTCLYEFYCITFGLKSCHVNFIFTYELLPSSLLLSGFYHCALWPSTGGCRSMQPTGNLKMNPPLSLWGWMVS